MFHNGGTQSDHVLLDGGSCGISMDEGLDLEDFSDSGSQENSVDSGEEIVPVDLEADSSGSNNDSFIFIIGMYATSRIKL